MSALNPELLRVMHTSLCITWGTDAPYNIGSIRGEKVGYAQDPCVVVSVSCYARDVPALVPIVRQRVYGELAERGWDPLKIEFSPNVLTHRKRKFRDTNEQSPSYGKNKIAEHHDFRFLMLPELAKATFHGPGMSGYMRTIPDRGPRFMDA
jgi:hypothetical protein